MGQPLQYTEPFKNLGAGQDGWWITGGGTAWASRQTALDKIPVAKRLGLTILYIQDGGIIEAWWKDGTADEQLVPKLEVNAGTVDVLAPGSLLSTLLTSVWTDEEKTLNGVNLNGQLGVSGQRLHYEGDSFFCIDHDFGTNTLPGWATYIRTKGTNFVTDSSITTQLLSASSWSNNLKTINITSSVGAYWTTEEGYLYICYQQSGNSFLWRRYSLVPDVIYSYIYDDTLISELQGVNWFKTDTYQPVAAVKGEVGQKHVFEQDGYLLVLEKVIVSLNDEVWTSVVRQSAMKELFASNGQLLII